MPQINNIYKRNEETGNAEKDPVLEEYLKSIGSKIAHIDLQTDLFDNISFPSLPNNWEFQMSDLEFPTKSHKNPNGTLFMKPRDIDRTSANDIAMQCFGGEFKKETMNPDSNNESLTVNDYIIKMLFEDTADPSITDAEILTQDIKSRNERMTNLNTTICRAITTYIKRSIDVIKPLLEMVGGAAEVKKVMKSIETANQTAYSNVTDWLSAHSDVEQYKEQYEKRKQLDDLRDKIDNKDNAQKVFACILLALDPENGESKIKYIQNIERTIENISNSKDLNSFVKEYCDEYYKYDDFQRDMEHNHNNQPFPVKLKKTPENESIIYNGENMIVEDVINKIFEDDSSSESSSSESINFDEVYDNLLSYLTNAITEAIGPRSEWTCLKDVKTAMQELKKRVDEECKNKIAIVCKTNGQKSLIHHPFKAEGLLSMWDRYSKELDVRIDNRYSQLVGSNGSMDTGSAHMVEDFLRVTYPQIISMMLTYKMVFAFLAKQYKGNYIPEYTREDIQQIVQANQENDLIRFSLVITVYDTETSRGVSIP